MTPYKEPVQESGGSSPCGCEENAIRVQSAALAIIAGESSERLDALAGAVQVKEEEEVSRPASSTCPYHSERFDGKISVLLGAPQSEDVSECNGPARSVSRK